MRIRHAMLPIALALAISPPHDGGLLSSPAAAQSPTAPAPPLSPFAGTRWKAVLLAGDSSAPVFDNATRAFSRLLENRGVQVVATFTADRAKVSPAVQFATHDELEKLPELISGAAGEACLLFATSHGNVQGLRLPQDPRKKTLSPATLKRILTRACGHAPTVVIISACHSGTFIRASTVGPNLVILTAARKDRASFGCQPERRYTYFDGCLLTEFPHAATWHDLHARVLTCIQGKEASRREKPSEPQAFFGREVEDLPLPRAR